MRPLGTPEQLAKRRQKTLDLLKSGETIKEIARQLGTTERSVRRWRGEVKHPKKKSKRGPAWKTKLPVETADSKAGTRVAERSIRSWVCGGLLDTGSEWACDLGIVPGTLCAQRGLAIADPHGLEQPTGAASGHPAG